MPQQPSNGRLDGWKAIAEYLGWHERTVIRWEKQKHLPVHRVGGGKRAPVYAYQQEIDLWFSESGIADLGTSNDSIDLENPAMLLGDDPRQSFVPAHHWIRYGVPAALVLVLTLVGVAWRLPHRSRLAVSSVTQLTSDGIFKDAIVTDGKTLYFGERSGDEEYISSVSIDGGAVKRIPTTVANPYPQDICEDGSQLLVLSRDNLEDEHALWVVPVDHRRPSTRMKGVASRAAAWAPQQRIVFGHGNGLFLTNLDGTGTRFLANVGGNPMKLQWSEDHHFLLVAAESAVKDSLWLLEFDSAMNLKHMEELAPSKGEAWERVSLAWGNGAFFTLLRGTEGTRIVTLKPEPNLFGDSRTIPLDSQFQSIQGLAASPNHQHLFVLTFEQMRSELVRYDPMSQSFTEFLPGTSAEYVDFAPQKDRVAYIRMPDYALWVSNTDGTSARCVSPPGMEVQLPRWSPNGKQIAFMGRVSKRPYRTFILSLDEKGPVPHEASVGDDNQGAPTWSPDGRSLIYGALLCQGENTCAIHRIDLGNKKISTIPGSQGLSTARWSPNGKYIAALNAFEHRLYVLDMSSGTWRAVVGNINGSDINWSSDSRFVYTKTSMGGRSEILRVPAKGGEAETVVNLDSFSRSAGQLDLWFGLTPDNAIMLNRILNAAEVYRVDYN